MSKLDKEEKELVESFDAGEWKSVRDKEGALKRYQDYARATFRKDRRVNIRITSKDLEALQKRALMEYALYTGGISELEESLERDEVVFHSGSIRGAFPRVVDER